MSVSAFYVAVPSVIFTLGLIGIILNAMTLTVLGLSEKLRISSVCSWCRPLCRAGDLSSHRYCGLWRKNHERNFAPQTELSPSLKRQACRQFYSKANRGPFHIMLMSLCVSDILAGVESLFWAIGMCSIPHDPDNMLYKYADFMTYYPTGVTTIHVCCFCVFRFVSCQWPHRKISSKHAKWMAVLVWGSLALYTIVCFVVVQCLPEVDREYKDVTAKIGGTILCVSLVIMTTFTCCLVISIKRSRKRIMQHLSDKARTQRVAGDTHVSVQLVLIVVSFYLGYIPLCVFFWLQATQGITSVHVLRQVAYLCLRVSECLNPIFYNVASRTMRKETKCLLKRFGRLFSDPFHHRLQEESISLQQQREASGKTDPGGACVEEQK